MRQRWAQGPGLGASAGPALSGPVWIMGIGNMGPKSAGGVAQDLGRNRHHTFRIYTDTVAAGIVDIPAAFRAALSFRAGGAVKTCAFVAHPARPGGALQCAAASAAIAE